MDTAGLNGGPANAIGAGSQGLSSAARTAILSPNMPAALLVIDIQHALCTGDEAAFDIGNIIVRVNGLIAKARAASAPVIVIQHEEADGALRFGTPSWQLAGDVAAQPGDLRVRKTKPDSFRETALQALLQERGIDRVVVCGLQSDCCIAATVRGAVERGYGVTLAADAHSTMDSGGIAAAQIIARLNAALAGLVGAGSGAAVAVRPAAEVSLGA